MMTNEYFDNYLKGRYENQVQWYDGRSALYKRCYHCFQWATIILSSALPASIMLIPDDDKIYVVALSVILAIATSAMKSFKFQENWISYRTIAESLRKEVHYYNAGANGYSISENKEQLFVERVEALISRENTLWGETHKKSKSVPKQLNEVSSTQFRS